MYKKEIEKILCPVTYGPPCMSLSIAGFIHDNSISITKIIDDDDDD